MRFYREASASGGFERGIQTALRVIFTSPAFLYRSEPDPADLSPGTVYALDDLALASRLSFFLWSSLPDDALISRAEQGRLRDDAVYAGEIARMLEDPRSSALVENFAGQWLFLRNLKSVSPDAELFPNFDDNLRRAMRKETELLFEHIMREDLSVLDLLTAQYTFVNDRLAEHYGINGVKGSHFRKVEIDGHHRRGLLGHASILTVTSYPNRTSPVLRGKWIMENVLGTPTPAPPADVPALEENEPGQAGRSVRERLAEHRENPVCATCHDVMDPLGLALENFDAIGRWRVRDEGGPVDASGQMVNGAPIDGPQSLLDEVTAEPEEFVRLVTEKLMVYALGRGLEAYDMPTVRQIARDAAEQDYRFSAIVSGIAHSVPFRMKRAAETAQPDALSAAGSESARNE
jgi:hypothetical protein